MKHPSLKIIILFSAILLGNLAVAQHSKLKVLFLGNSFTATNNLPNMTAQIAISMGDTLIQDSNTPGAYLLHQHAKDATSLAKIAAGDWNYVVLQEQSENTAFPDAQVEVEVKPYAHILDSIIHKKNPCGRSVFYMTWGYPGGDPANCPHFPPICTYRGMDSMINLRYTQMAADNKALLSPVGLVFNVLIKKAPGINLFASDKIHPSPAGTYAAALTFYTILFRSDPLRVSFNGPLSAADAGRVKNAVRSIVFTDLARWHVGAYDPKVSFTSAISGNVVTFNSGPCVNTINYNWNFGDGNSSTLANPVHTYVADGTYEVKLNGDNCSRTDSSKQTITTNTSAINNYKVSNNVKIYPNPARSVLTIEIMDTAPLQNATIRLMNTMGVQVKSMPFTAQINVTALPAGTYFLTVSDESGLLLKSKFTKEP